MIYQGSKRYPVHTLCLHTAATPGNWHVGMSTEEMVAEMRRWHVQYRGWRNIGYHRVGAPKGEIGIGRSIYEIGAGVKGHNRGVIHYCLVPVNDHDGIGRFEDYFTEAQEESLREYISDLSQLTDLKEVVGHNQFARKECPGFIVRTSDWLPS